MSNRPTCQQCKKEDCAVMVIHNEYLCGQCVQKYVIHIQQKNKKAFDEWKNSDAI